jgi:prepilin-type N-terminal cleavage/methylation domain-containing protein
MCRALPTTEFHTRDARSHYIKLSRDRKGAVKNERGVTLIEMLVVVAIIAVMIGIAFPSATSGIDSIRLASAADRVSAFLTSAVNRCERNQIMLELTVSKPENALYIRAVPNFEQRLQLDPAVTIAAVLPDVPVDPAQPRRFLLYPGGATPRIGVRLVNQRGVQRIVSLDPVTGAAIVERVAQ